MGSQGTTVSVSDSEQLVEWSGGGREHAAAV